jgi:hypothetical protein
MGLIQMHKLKDSIKDFKPSLPKKANVDETCINTERNSEQATTKKHHLGPNVITYFPFARWYVCFFVVEEE